MGIEAYKLGSALRGIVAQRLMRRLCPACREALPVPPGDLLPEQARGRVPDGAQLYKAVGCAECAQTGYRGRFSITEILTMTQDLEQLIGEGATADRIGRLARQQGMKSLWESGLRHVVAGETSIDELLRVCDVPGHGGLDAGGGDGATGRRGVGATERRGDGASSPDWASRRQRRPRSSSPGPAAASRPRSAACRRRSRWRRW
jgi:hypothetical protein